MNRDAGPVGGRAGQAWIYAAVAGILILAVGVKWPRAAIWGLGLIFLAALVNRWESIREVIR